MATLSRQRAGFTLCLTGPESSGKTTLALELGASLRAPVVAEEARAYLEGRESYGAEDVLAIAERQLAREAQARAETAGTLILDTDIVVLTVWWQEKYGALPELMVEALRERSPRAYLLTKPDLPWVPDPQRENPHDRQRLFERYLALLEETGSSFRVVSGTGAERAANALAAARELLDSAS